MELVNNLLQTDNKDCAYMYTTPLLGNEDHKRNNYNNQV
jgi:hypothetical protein